MKQYTKTTAYKEQAFTLIELLVVISIIVLLAGLMVSFVGGSQDEANAKATRSLLSRVELAIGNYKGLVGYLPPDGFDSPVKTPEGTELKSGAALGFALTQDIPKFVTSPSGKKGRQGNYPAICGANFTSGELYVFEDDPAAVEILDPWGNPLHYDCLDGGKNSYSLHDADGDYRLELDDDAIEIFYSSDPREEKLVQERTGPQNIGRFDLWSAGPTGYTEKANFESIVANWDINSAKEQAELKSEDK